MISAASLREGAETCGYFGRRPCLENFLTSSPPTSARHYLTHTHQQPTQTHKCRMHCTLKLTENEGAPVRPAIPVLGPFAFRLAATPVTRIPATSNTTWNEKNKCLRTSYLQNMKPSIPIWFWTNWYQKGHLIIFGRGAICLVGQLSLKPQNICEAFCLCVLSLSIDTVLITIGWVGWGWVGGWNISHT